MSRYATNTMIDQWEAAAPPSSLRAVTIETTDYQTEDGRTYTKYFVYVADETHPHGRALYAMVNTPEEAEAEKERADVCFNYRCPECLGDVRKCDCIPF
jgi:hypothetical protein